MEIIFGSAANWYCSSIASSSIDGQWYAFGSSNVVSLINLRPTLFNQDHPSGEKDLTQPAKGKRGTAKSKVQPKYDGVLIGHKRRSKVSAVMFAQHEGLESICVSGDLDGSILTWDVKSKRCLGCQNIHESKQITCIDASTVQPGLFVSCDVDGYVAAWFIGYSDNKQALEHQDQKDEAHRDNTRESVTISDILSTRLPEKQSYFKPLRSGSKSTCRITSVVCSKANNEEVALGYRTGALLVVNIWTQQIVCQFPGHDEEIQSLSWVSLQESHLQKSIMVSSARDKAIKVWDTSCISSGCVPGLIHEYDMRNASSFSGHTSRNWISVTLVQRELDLHLIASFGRGELGHTMIPIADICSDVRIGISNSIKKLEPLVPNSFSKNQEGHSRPIFKISHLQKLDLIITVSMDRTICIWSVAEAKCMFRIPGLGGYAYGIDVNKNDPNLVAIGVGDNSIRVLHRGKAGDRFRSTLIWRGLQAKVTAVKWHPLVDEESRYYTDTFSVLAYGCEDGRVAVCNVFSSRQTKFKVQHPGSVEMLCWIRRVEKIKKHKEPNEISPQTFDQKWNVISVGGGNAYCHTVDIGQSNRSSGKRSLALILKPGGVAIESKIVAVDCVDSQENSILAVGTEKGHVYILEDFESGKILRSFSIYTFHVSSLNWAQGMYLDRANNSQELFWLATASTKGDINILKSPSPTFDVVETLALKTRTHGKHMACKSFTWNNNDVKSFHEQMGREDVKKDDLIVRVAACFIGIPLIQVWNAINGEPLARFEGLQSNIRTIVWDFDQSNTILGGGEDQLLIEWDCKTNPVVGPPVYVKGKPIEEKTVETSSKTFPEKPSAEDAVETENAASIQTEDETNEQIQEQNESFRKAKSKPKKSRSIIPLCNTIVPKNETDALLAISTKTELNTNWMTAISKEKSIDDKIKILVAQADHSRGVSHAAFLALWGGDVAGALEYVAKNKMLNSSWIALAPAAGYDVWKRMAVLFALQLEENKDVHGAVMQYLAVDEVNKAVEVYLNADLCMDALILAYLRLGPGDPIIDEALVRYGNVLRNRIPPLRGLASLAYCAAGRYDRASKVLEEAVEFLDRIPGIQDPIQVELGLLNESIKYAEHADNGTFVQLVLKTSIRACELGLWDEAESVAGQLRQHAEKKLNSDTKALFGMLKMLIKVEYYLTQQTGDKVAIKNIIASMKEDHKETSQCYTTLEMLLEARKEDNLRDRGLKALKLAFGVLEASECTF